LLAYELHGENSVTLDRWKYLADHPEDVDVRQVLRFESQRMTVPHFWLGWGAGTYQYVLPPYLYADNKFQSSVTFGGSAIWTPYAHCDWLQFPVEYGALGAGLVLAMLLYGYGSALRLARKLGAAGVVVLLAASAMLAHATIDFPFFNAAVFTLFALLTASALKTVMLSTRRRV
jgi:hypothetical protein